MSARVIKVLWVAVIIALALLVWSLVADAQTLTCPARVVDGDTLEVAGQKVRLHGVDAPEKDQICTRKGSPYHCGAVSLVRLEELIDGRPVTCHPLDKDRYGVSARCFVSGGLEQREGRCCFRSHIDLGGWLVRNGYAVACTKYSRDYLPQETMARGGRLGLWSGSFVAPAEWRRGRR